MALTPEGRIKAKVSKLLLGVTDLYYFMPVQGGYGAASLDYLGVYKGRFFAIETKAPGKHPTPRQRALIATLIRSGAKVFVIDSDDLSQLQEWIDEVGR